METPFIALTLVLITTVQGMLVVNCPNSVDTVLLTDQVSAVALMEMLSLSRTQLILG